MLGAQWVGRFPPLGTEAPRHLPVSIPIKVFRIRTELLNNIMNAIFGWDRSCIKTDIGRCDHGGGGIMPCWGLI